MDARLQMTAREAAAKFAACDVNWWTCIREEIIGPDSQELKNIYDHYHQLSSIAPSTDWRKTPEHRK